jgi:uncharacterized membrane protein
MMSVIMAMPPFFSLFVVYIPYKYMYNVAYLLEARTLEPEKQPLLGNVHTKQ